LEAFSWGGGKTCCTGKLTEKQLEQYEKLVKKYEKKNNILFESKKIQGKEMDQDGGLTDGQRLQVERNDKALAQIEEQIESLEETIYEMVEDSEAGGLKRKKSSKRRRHQEDEIDSDDDEFFNRAGDTTKTKKAKNKAENVDTLTAKLKILDDKRYAIEEKMGACKRDSVANQEVDALDAYMLDVKGQQADEDKRKLQEQLWAVDAEEKELRMLLKVAAPALAGLSTMGAAREDAKKAAEEAAAKQEEAPDEAAVEAAKLKEEEEQKAQAAAAELKPDSWVEKRTFGGQQAPGAALVEQKQAPLLLGSAATVDKVGNMTGHTPGGPPQRKPVVEEENWLDGKKGGLQKNPKRAGAKRIKIGPQLGPNGGALQESRYKAEESGAAWVPPTTQAQGKLDDLKKKLGY